jgi:hypothetical protein
MTTHTPGPWEVITSPHALPQVYSAWRDNSRECITDRVFNGNAKLIAAAPELLAALQCLAELAEKQLNQSATHDGLTNCAAIARAREVISKATN